jgi:hypothetical protein
MSEVDETVKSIEKNFNRFRALCEKLGDRAPAVLAGVDSMAERIAMAPASGRLEYHNAFPGGLVEHSLRVLHYAMVLSKALNIRVTKESLIISALFHDFGKVGDLDHEYYLEEESQWHRERGKTYNRNPEIRIKPTGQGALFLLQAWGVPLSQDEYMAILLNDGQYTEENRSYRMCEPDLAMVIHQADIWACREEKDMSRRTL